MKNKKKLGEILVEFGFISKDSLEQVLSQQKKSAKRLGEILVEMQLLRKSELVRALAHQCELPFIDKLPDKPDPALSNIIPMEFMERYQIVPYSMAAGHLKIATVNPQSLLFLDNLTLSLKLTVELAFTTWEEMARVLGYFDRMRSYFSEGKLDAVQNESSEKGAIIDMVKHVIREGVQLRASDIHLEVAREQFKIRYRVDGILRDAESPPKELSQQVVSRLKVLAGMDLADKRTPQDGRIRFEVDKQPVDLRVSILPSLHGESVVLRILQRRNLRIGLSGLGFGEAHMEMFRSMISLPYGMIFVTGPTGSGKTTTLYGALETLNNPSEKIITVEDPIEYEMDGINQVQVKPDIGLTFAMTLRAMLRQAPTVILVGEIRDFETAEIAVQAALTGHLVFSTLHTNDAIAAIPRLIDLGVKPYLVAAATQGVIAQRLVRRICPSCSVPVEHDPTAEAFFQKRKIVTKHSVFYRGSGCAECNHTGYKGRVAIFEMIPVDESMRLAITRDHADVDGLRRIAKGAGMEGLFYDGLEKAAKGLTTLEEVLRVVEAEDENV